MNRFGAPLALLCLTIAGLVATPAARAEIIVVKKISYFTIGGTTAADLDREMLTRGPMSSTTGHRHPGATSMKSAGTATFVARDGRCVIGGARVMLSIHIMLPRWSNRRKASPQLALIWDVLSADIRRHEERHAEIARTHARDLERKILSLPSASTCNRLKDRVSELSRVAIEDRDKDQQRFDRIEAVNFENRMIRLLKYRIASKKTQ
jgi:predicted secreted Zn-dependent protease